MSAAPIVPPRLVDLRCHDTTLGIWQADPADPSFRTEIFGGLIAYLRTLGWSFRADPRVRRHSRSLSGNSRVGACGELRAVINVSGRHVKVEVWAETWPLSNRNGRRYDFDKRARMGFLTGLRFELLAKRIRAWLAGRAVVTVSETRDASPRGLTAMQLIKREWAASCRSEPTLGYPVCAADHDRRSADGGLVEHGATVWYADRKGRIGRGTAYYHINNMWWVVTDRWSRSNMSSRELFVRAPDHLRRKRNERTRRHRLEAEIAKAIRTWQLRRAARLRAILFGDEPLFLIRHRENGAYYRSCSSGYTTDWLSAGRYTRAEAEAEVRRVSHLLSAVALDGTPLTIQGLAA